MKKIGDIELYVGTKEEYDFAKDSNMKIVCALNRVSGFVTHQSVIGWSGRGCDPNHPHYLYKEEADAIYLNMIDGEDSKYVSDEMINPALSFIKKHLEGGNKVFVYCSLGESRSPSIALMYLLENGYLKMSDGVIDEFKNGYYPNYKPKSGNSDYILNRWKI